MPCNLSQAPDRAKVLPGLLNNPAFRWLAGFASGALFPNLSHWLSDAEEPGVFAWWAPDLFKYYTGHLALLFAHHPTLEKNFTNSIWPAATVNLDPRMVCVQHRDAANLAYGWCAITALGNLDPTRGGGAPHSLGYEIGG